MRKVLILGAGGTGARVITNVANLIDARIKQDINDLEYLKYFEMDTATSKSNNFIPGSDFNYEHLTVSEAEDRTFKNKCREGKHTWADPHVISKISDGAASIRMMGKYGFLHHYNDIYRAIETRLESLHNYKTEDMSSKTQIYIVANTASGTGSGCFLELGMLVQNLIKEKDYLSSNPNLKVTLIITIAADSNNADALRNTYYALQELNHYMMGNPYEIDHIDGNEKIVFNERAERNKRPFDFVYLIGSNAKVGITGVAAFENLISEYIYNDIYSSSAEMRDGRRDNLKKYIDQTDAVDQRPLYMSFGLSAIEYPSTKIMEAAAYIYISKALQEWFKPSNISNLNTSMYESEYFDTTLYGVMLAKCTLNGIILDYSQKLSATKEKAEVDFRNNNFDPDSLRKLIRDFDNGLAEHQLAKSSSNAIKQGDILHILDTNHAVLMRTLAETIKRDILEKLFSGQVGGIESAKKSVQNIIKKVGEFREVRINPAFEENKKRMDGICEAIEYIRDDPLLFNVLKIPPIKRLVSKFMKQFEKYAEIKVKNEIEKKLNYDLTINSKEKLFYMLENALITFSGNINTFESRMKAWQTDVTEKLQDSIKTPIINGHMVNRDEIEKLSENVVLEANVNQTVLVDTYLKEKYYKFSDEKTEKLGDLMEEELVEFNYTNNDIFSKVKMEHRDFIENKDVIEVFFEEQRKLARWESDNDSLKYAYDKVKEVWNKSQWFLDVEDQDDHFKIEDPLLQKIEWIFYPDGNEVKKKDEAMTGKNKFAKLLAQYDIIKITEWDYMSQSSNSSPIDKNIVLFLKERGLFPIRMLKILSSENMMKAINPRKIPTNQTNTFRSRVDMKFIALIPPDRKHLESLKLLLLKSIASEVIEVKESGKFTIKGAVPQERRDFSVPVEYNAAVAALNDNSDTAGILEEVFDEFYIDIKIAADADPSNDILKNYIIGLHGLQSEPGKFGLAVPNDQERREIALLIEKLILSDTVVRNLWNALYPDDIRLPNSYGKTVKKVDTSGDGYLREGFYCINKLSNGKECGQFLCSLENEHTIPKSCPSCHIETKK